MSISFNQSCALKLLHRPIEVKLYYIEEISIKIDMIIYDIKVPI